MSGNESETRLHQQWNLVKNAPMVFLITVGTISVAIWGVYQWGYGRIIEQRDSEISGLKTQVATVTAQRDTLNATQPQLSVPLRQHLPLLDPDKFYQFGDAVADFSGADIARSEGVVRFTDVIGGPNFNVNALTEFRQYYLGGCSYLGVLAEKRFDKIISTNYKQLTCHILAPRPG